MRDSKKLMQWVFLAAAGTASFYAAMVWRGSAAFMPPALVGAPAHAAIRTPSPTTTALPSSDTATASPVRDSTLTRPERTRAVPQADGDAFAKLSWLPPPPVVHVVRPKPVAPPIPVAPAIPFTFVGLMERGTTKPQAFLSKGDTLLVVAAGDVIDNNTYRVDALSEQQISLTYLPLNTPQMLPILRTSK
jgi:hypothetical protein